MSDAEFLLGNDYDSAKKGVTSTMSWKQFLEQVVRPAIDAEDVVGSCEYVNGRIKHAMEILKARAVSVHGAPTNGKDTDIMYHSKIDKHLVIIRAYRKGGVDFAATMKHHQFKDASFVVQELEKLIKKVSS
jgi:hypothetical protein